MDPGRAGLRERNWRELYHLGLLGRCHQHFEELRFGRIIVAPLADDGFANKHVIVPAAGGQPSSLAKVGESWVADEQDCPATFGFVAPPLAG
jgi:hypothetical protein